MGIFHDMLKADQTIFKNPVALEYEYLPKLIPFRENEQFAVAKAIKPLFQGRSGTNVVVYGRPGIGKTAAVRHILQELEEQTDDIVPFYLNCWQKNSTYKILLELCEQLEYKFTHNKKTDELFQVVAKIINKKAAVFVFDECDKAEESDYLYLLLNEIYKKSIILITNDDEWIKHLDARIKSRLTPDLIAFRPYTLEQVKTILAQRAEAAFYPGVLSDALLGTVAQKTYELMDLRTGLFLLREAGNSCEEHSRKAITAEDVNAAIQKLDTFTSKSKDALDPDEQLVLSIAKAHSGKKIGDLFALYQQQGGKGTYKTFQRRIDKLASNGYISVKKTQGGAEGNTTIIEASGLKKLTEF
ncbi:MAG: AAA family ATPase [Candidatus Woesearchaeota archaeon]